ncbi:aspartate 1-decarboxylase [Bradyrhizobium sp. CSA207]|uniref:aspartate 1-decarboxylase n=1 Tax=Bradyrhizobium sp. CSA207 TaxID=2698826 RepID=UPI0023B0330F|nr:aspartate 1-decarboxylase [Bradyrhizobium sp. CSA207]MDE5447034.1 aspartate 1-decarboxylase [Bradyrhizobium sp. CSA207]
MRKVLAAKLHGIHVTEANLHYHGWITLDPDQCREVGILPMEFVENENSGTRISTYVIFGERGSRCCVPNGAAARTRATWTRRKSSGRGQRSLTFDRENHITDRLTYSVTRDGAGVYCFDIAGGAGDTKSSRFKL